MEENKDYKVYRFDYLTEGIDSQEIFSQNYEKIADYHLYIQRRRSR